MTNGGDAHNEPDSSHDEIPTVDPPTVPAELVPAKVRQLDFRRLLAQSAELEEYSKAPATRDAYNSDLADFARWCPWQGLPHLPAEPATVYAYLSFLVEGDNAAGWAMATLRRRLSAIGFAHEDAGYPNPCRHVRVTELMKALGRRFGRPADKRHALSTDQLRQMIAPLDLDMLSGLRDRALLLVGFATAIRRANLASLTVEQLTRRSEGYVVRLLRTKVDQEAVGRAVGIPAFPDSPWCPVAALDAWLTRSETTEGPVWRRVTRYQTVGTDALHPSSVALIVKRAARAAGIPSSKLAGHSLRAGHVTEASENGAPSWQVMRQTDHKRIETLNGYIRSHGVFRDNSARYLRLDRSTAAAEGESDAP